MEECEALCSRIAIMVSGQFECIGSLQHLRTKFGKGYRLYIKIDKLLMSDDYFNSLRNEINTRIPSSRLMNKYELSLEYNIENKDLKWSFLFHTMDEIKREFKLEDYLLSDSTLEQIFLSFAKKQVIQSVETD